MSTDIPDSFPNFDASTLEALLVDPAVRDVLNEVDALNKESEGGLTYQRAHEYSHYLEEKWHKVFNLLYENAQLSGRIDYYESSPEYPEGRVTRQLVSDIEVRSEGFTFVPVNEGAYYDTVIDPEDEDTLYELCPLFTRIVRDEDGFIFEEVPFTIEPSNLISLAFEFSMSLDQAQEILRYYTPEIIEQIDAIIDNADLNDEIGASFLLGEKIWDLSSHGEDEIKIIRAINVYIECMLGFDKLTYAAIFNGPVFIVEGGEPAQPHTLECDTPTLITINKLCFMRPIPEDDSTAEGDEQDTFITAYIDCYKHDDDKTVPDIHVIMPVTNIEYAVALRTKFAELNKPHDDVDQDDTERIT